MIRTVWVLVLGLLVSVCLVMATAQSPDILYYNGVEYGLSANPLQPYLELNPEVMPRGNVISSANWRGYIATWEIKDKKLYLKDVTVTFHSDLKGDQDEYKEKSVLRDLFPSGNEVLADWYKGLLVIPLGEMVEYVHMGYGSTFEKYLLIQVENGVVVKEKQFNCEEYKAFRKRQFEEFKKTQEYLDYVKEIKEQESQNGGKSRSQESLDSFLFVYAPYTSSLLVELDE